MNPRSFIGKHKLALDTPCLVVDIDILKKNLRVMQLFGRQNNIRVRPHCKTHKCSTLARMQIEHGAIGLCVTKLSEAEALISRGLDNILITSPLISDNKLQRFEACLRKSPSLMIVVDNANSLKDINDIGCRANTKINVLIDIDAGIGRTGINKDSVLEFAKSVLVFPWLNLQGIQCYAGHVQHIHTYDERKRRSLSIMQSASSIVSLLREQGISCNILTGTGTGTYDIDTQQTLVTEIQPGSYAVMDVEYFEVESAAHDKFNTFGHALTLLTTVISSNRTEHVTVDAGTKSIYFDKSTKPKIISHPELDYDWGGFGDEHGKITSTGKLPPAGSVLELIVPHCDPTINLYDNFFIIENDMVMDVWPIDLRGKSQ